MRLFVASGNCRNVQLQIPFQDFLSSGHVCRQAKAAMCSPEDLIVDYLPKFEASDADEVCEAFGEACEQAVDGEVYKVKLDQDDLSFVEEHFIQSRRFRLVNEYPYEAA